MTTDIVFYDLSKQREEKEGLFHISSNRHSINPVFKIELNPNETKTYYIKASSYVTTLIIKLNLYSEEFFFQK